MNLPRSVYMSPSKVDTYDFSRGNGVWGPAMPAPGSPRRPRPSGDAPASLVAALATHRWARLPDLERLARVPPAALRARALEVRGVREAVAVATCNRVEVYVACDDPDAAQRGLRAMLAPHLPPGRVDAVVRFRRERAAAEHLFRVSAGLDAMVVGEPQVLGQVADAFEDARAEGAAGRHLTLLFHRAIAAGKRVRTETAVGKGAVSVGSAAAALARHHLGRLQGKRVVVLGTGAMGALAAQAFAADGARVTVAGRHAGRAAALAAKVGGATARSAELPALAAEADVLVFAAASPRALLDAARLAPMLAARRGRPLLLLDLGNPRNVAGDAGGLPGVRLLDLDGLRLLRQANLAARRSEGGRVRGLLREELAALRAAQAEQRAEDLLRALYTRSEALRAAEVRRALALLGPLGRRERDVVEDLAASLVRKVLATPAAGLRHLARGDDREGLRVAAQVLGVALEESDVSHPPTAKAATR